MDALAGRPKGVTLKLNLGAGKVTFPMTDERRAALHPLTPIPVNFQDTDWLNVDHFDMPGIDIVTDLFRFPWEFDDNSVDEIWCSHLIEHIPHETRRSDARQTDAANARWDAIKHLDGFFAFFAEVYRILKPGGAIAISCPYGLSTEAMQDPTHTRFIVPKTFGYLAGGDEEHYNYHTPFKFRVGENVGDLSLSMNPRVQAFPHEQQMDAAETMFNMAREIRIVLYAVK